MQQGNDAAKNDLVFNWIDKYKIERYFCVIFQFWILWNELNFTNTTLPWYYGTMRERRARQNPGHPALPWYYGTVREQRARQNPGHTAPPWCYGAIYNHHSNTYFTMVIKNQNSAQSFLIYLIFLQQYEKILQNHLLPFSISCAAWMWLNIPEKNSYFGWLVPSLSWHAAISLQYCWYGHRLPNQRTRAND